MTEKTNTKTRTKTITKKATNRRCTAKIGSSKNSSKEMILLEDFNESLRKEVNYEAHDKFKIANYSCKR